MAESIVYAVPVEGRMKDGVRTEFGDAASDLASRIAHGDRDAEIEFARQYEYGVRVLLRRRCRPGDPVVDDLVQDVLSNVLQQLRKGAIQDGSALPAYIQTAAARAATAEYRRRPRHEPLAKADDLPGEGDPRDELARDELKSILLVLLSELAVVRDRQVLVRFYLDELSKDEVCHELDIEPSHFHRVIFRARHRFRELLESRGMGGVR